jgi:uncharacterized protein
LTPFTNTLPINRLKLAEKQHEQIPVLYLDILGGQAVAVQQKYTRLSPISVDASGLVVKYPGLFERTYIAESDYR